MFLGRCPLSVGRKQLLVMLRVKFPQGQWRSVFQCHSVFFPDSNLDLDTGDVTLMTKVHIIKVTAFPLAMCRCESWTIRKAECQRSDVFELWCWRRLLRVPWSARRSNQSILKDISPEYSLERLMMKLKFQYFGHLMR